MEILRHIQDFTKKTRLILKSIHNINISYQSIEDIILSFKYSNKNKNRTILRLLSI